MNTCVRKFGGLRREVFCKCVCIFIYIQEGVREIVLKVKLGECLVLFFLWLFWCNRKLDELFVSRVWPKKRKIGCECVCLSLYSADSCYCKPPSLIICFRK